MKPVPVYVGKIFEEVSSAERGARGREDKRRRVHQKMVAEPDYVRSQ
jgi:hypothetical protein